jgi:serine/threonine protein kinase
VSNFSTVLWAPTNQAVFLGDDNSVKLGDFGLSKILQSHDFASTYVGTPFYMSPEICKAEQYGPHSDIWALGCIIYELCAKAPPFNAKTHFELIQKIKLGRYPEIPSCYSAELRKVIASCLQTFPTSRPDTAQLLNLPVVKLMRKEQEVVKLGHDLKQKTEKAARQTKEAQEIISRQNEQLAQMRQEIDSQLRREWEVKARLEINKQVELEVERRHQIELTILQKRFDEAVAAAVAKALENHPTNPSTSPKLAPRSSTPTMPAEQQLLFSAETVEPTPTLNGGSSFSTLGTGSNFTSGTDLSSLSHPRLSQHLQSVQDVCHYPAPALCSPPHHMHLPPQWTSKWRIPRHHIPLSQASRSPLDAPHPDRTSSQQRKRARRGGKRMSPPRPRKMNGMATSMTWMTWMTYPPFLRQHVQEVFLVDEVGTRIHTSLWL